MATGISQSLGSVLIHGYDAAGVFYEPYLTETYDVASNSSTLSIAHRIRIMEEWGGQYIIPDSTPIYITIDGTKTTFNPKNYGTVNPNNVPVTVATTTQTVTHNADGKKTIAISCRWNNSSAQYQGATPTINVKLTDIPRTPSAPTSVSITANQGNYVAGGDTVTISWSGASGGLITGYKIQYSKGNSGWTDLKTVSSSATSGSTTDTVSIDSNLARSGAGKALKYRVCALNGSLASSYKESNTLYILGSMRIKASNSWHQGSVWIKVNGTWRRAKRVWIKVNGTWKYSI
jgi:hypothetical protein